jgi:hypothetical protein
MVVVVVSSEAEVPQGTVGASVSRVEERVMVGPDHPGTGRRDQVVSASSPV